MVNPKASIKKKAGFSFLIFVILITLSIGILLEFRYVEFQKNADQEAGLYSLAFFFAVVNLNVVLLFILVFVVFKQVVKLTVERKNSLFGSSLRTKLVTSFLFFSLLPSLLLLYVSTKFVNANFEKWLPRNIVQSTQISVKNEEYYLSSLTKLLNSTPLETIQQNFKGTFFKIDPYSSTNEIPTELLDSIGHVIPEGKNFRIFLNQNEDSFDGTFRWFIYDKLTHISVKLHHKDSEKILYIFVGPQTSHAAWHSLGLHPQVSQQNAEVIEISYYIMLAVITLLVIFSAIWLGFTVAREFANPLLVLVEATQSIAQGNYDVQIDDIVSDDEIGMLARDFKSMTGDLKSAQLKLHQTMLAFEHKARELEIKNQFQAFLIENISTAVIVLNQTKRLVSWNQRAAQLFVLKSTHEMEELSEVGGTQLFEFLSQHIFQTIGQDSASMGPVGFSGVILGKETRLEISASSFKQHSQGQGIILLINDITELVKVQKLAAWKEVAKRMAHEIKNPLTPIQLGAQRIEKKLKQDYAGYPNPALQECFQVIIQGVHSIRGLVDEFIEFSRLPQSVFTIGNILEPFSLALAGFRDNPDSIPLTLIRIQKDGSVLKMNQAHQLQAECAFDFNQVHRLVSNVLANAKAAVALENLLPLREPELKCEIVIDDLKQSLVLKVIDNGCGIPKDIKSRLFEPYFTTKRSGMGIGLVIVQQIALEHGWKLWFEDNLPNGTICNLEVPRVRTVYAVSGSTLGNHEV